MLVKFATHSSCCQGSAQAVFGGPCSRPLALEHVLLSGPLLFLQESWAPALARGAGGGAGESYPLQCRCQQSLKALH